MAASATQPNTGLGRLPSRPRNDAFGPRLMPKSFGSGTGEPVAPPPQVGLTKPKLKTATAAAIVTTARATPRTRSADTAVTRPSSTAAAMPASGASGKADPRIDRQMRHGEAGDAGERELDDRDLPDEAGDDHERESHHDADQRVRQRLAEVERQHDERDRAQDRRGDRERVRVLRARHVREALLDELAACRQRRAAQEHRRHDEHEDEQLLDARPAPRPGWSGTTTSSTRTRSATRPSRCRGRRRTRS